MTTTTNSTKRATSRNGRPHTSPAVTPRVTQTRVLRSEWIKIHTVRSTVWAVVAVAASVIGGAAFAAVGIVVKDSPPAATAVATDPSGGTLSGTGLAQLAVIGVVAVTGEYRTRMIRSSLTAVPTRLPLVWGKAAVVAASTTVLSLASLLLSFLVASLVVATEDLSISLSTPGVTPAMIGAALALGVTGALTTGFGWLLRNTPAAVFLLLAVFYVVPTLATLLPARRREGHAVPSEQRRRRADPGSPRRRRPAPRDRPRRLHRLRRHHPPRRSAGPPTSRRLARGGQCPSCAGAAASTAHQIPTVVGRTSVQQPHRSGCPGNDGT